MKFRMEFGLDNSAFGETAEERTKEIIRILHETGKKLITDPDTWSVRDINGNLIGFFEVAA